MTEVGIVAKRYGLNESEQREYAESLAEIARWRTVTDETREQHRRLAMLTARLSAELRRRDEAQTGATGGTVLPFKPRRIGSTL